MARNTWSDTHPSLNSIDHLLHSLRLNSDRAESLSSNVSPLLYMSVMKCRHNRAPSPLLSVLTGSNPISRWRMPLLTLVKLSRSFHTLQYFKAEPNHRARVPSRHWPPFL